MLYDYYFMTFMCVTAFVLMEGFINNSACIGSIRDNENRETQQKNNKRVLM